MLLEGGCEHELVLASILEEHELVLACPLEEHELVLASTLAEHELLLFEYGCEHELVLFECACGHRSVLVFSGRFHHRCGHFLYSSNFPLKGAPRQFSDLTIFEGFCGWTKKTERCSEIKMSLNGCGVVWRKEVAEIERFHRGNVMFRFRCFA